jgi:replicative superfamily II helicase
MNHWLLDSIADKRREALLMADKAELYREIIFSEIEIDIDLIHTITSALELAVLDLLKKNIEDDPDIRNTMINAAVDAFRLFKVLPLPNDPLESGSLLLRASALAILGDRGADAARWLRSLKEHEKWPMFALDSTDWGERTWSTVIEVWLCLCRKNGWTDCDNVLHHIAQLREYQNEFEKAYFDTINENTRKTAALELIGLYHLAKAAEILACFITDGVVEGNRQVQQLLDAQFDRALIVCQNAQVIKFEAVTRLLVFAAKQMVSNSIWTVTRAVNSRVTQFVHSLVERGRGNKVIFDVLPPQRRTLAEKGLLGSSRRAVVVSLPTSSGKTLIAQFRILQALNQFDDSKGWVAYLVPTRTLVNQITRQLRSDFASLKIIVERVSPALEIDNIEMKLLTEMEAGAKFRVLVTTPEKLDLMLRKGIEKQIERPLTLVIVDEAHNIQSPQRGLKLELLLATINKECEFAQFLLLTPFVNNAREVARWLGGQNAEDMSLGLDWQPNDRVIGVVSAQKGDKIRSNSYDYNLSFKPVHTTRNTINTDEWLLFPKESNIAPTFAKANEPGKIAAITAQFLKKRGPVIIMHGRPDWVWGLAGHLKITTNRKQEIHQDVQLVQNYIQLELGPNFPLIDLLAHGIGVHHSGLPEEVRFLMEWLFENGHLDFLVATTTIAQGVNFPVSGVVLASHQYFSERGAENMPPEDFWNIAGRAGRISQGQLGVVALAADSKEKEDLLYKFINQNTGDLNSALISMALDAKEKLNDLGKVVVNKPEWSSFLQYLVHTYRQMGNPATFTEQVEQVLRGTFGFEKLRIRDSQIANLLLDGVVAYTDYITRPRQPLSLVDSTGFSLNSINIILVTNKSIDSNSWNPNTLFSNESKTLRDMMGILLGVPELRENLQAVTGGDQPNGNTLSLIVKDWVNGISIPELARKYFQRDGELEVEAITRCGQNLFGKLTQTTSWGLGALLSITGGELEDEHIKNLPSRAFYGVNSDEAIVMRLLGIPRLAASSMARMYSIAKNTPLPQIRAELLSLQDSDWQKALGESGSIYRKVWCILEGEDI